MYNIFKKKTAILNCNNISQYCYVFDQINAALVSIIIFKNITKRSYWLVNNINNTVCVHIYEMVLLIASQKSLVWTFMITTENYEHNSLIVSCP